STQSRSDMESCSQLATPPPKPVLELRSGWDDMLEDKKKFKLWSPIRKSPTSRTTSPNPISLNTASPHQSRASTPTPSVSASYPTVCGEDDAFIKSTLDYLGSPVAKTLGMTPSPTIIPASPIASPIFSPAPVYISPYKETHYDLSYHCPPVRSVHDMPPSPRNVPTDVESIIS
ncbi:hypothetical protein C0991_006894, partial [Blastosporella zonata]